MRFISETSLTRWVTQSIDCLPPVINSTNRNDLEVIKDTTNSNNLRYFVTRYSNWNVKALSCVENIKIIKDKTTDLLFYGLESGIHENNDIYHYMVENSLIFEF